MGNYSDAHIGQCLSRLMTLRRNSTVMINVAAAEEGDCRKTGMQFAEGMLRVADGLLQLGLKPGHVVAIAALNRFSSPLLCSSSARFLHSCMIISHRRTWV